MERKALIILLGVLLGAILARPAPLLEDTTPTYKSSNRPDEPLPVIPLATTPRSHISERDVTTFTTEAGGDEVADTTPGPEEAPSTTEAAPIHNNTTNQDAITTVKINVVPLRTSTATPGAETTSAGVTSSSEEGGPTTQYTTRSFFKKRDADYGSEEENDSNDSGVDGDDGPPDGGDFVKSLTWKRDVRDSDSYDIPYTALGRRRRSAPITSDETSVDPPYADLIKKRIARDTDTDSDAETTPEETTDEETTDEEKTPDTSEEDGTDDEAPDDVPDRKKRDADGGDDSDTDEDSDGDSDSNGGDSDSNGGDCDDDDDDDDGDDADGGDASDASPDGGDASDASPDGGDASARKRRDTEPESADSTPSTAATGVPASSETVTGTLRPIPNAIKSSLVDLRKTIEQFESVVALTLLGGTGLQLFPPIVIDLQTPTADSPSINEGGSDAGTTKNVLEHTTVSDDKESSTTLRGSDAGTTKNDVEPTIESDDKESSTTLHGSDAGTTKSVITHTTVSDDKESSTSLHRSDAGTTKSDIETTIGSDDKESLTSLRGSDVSTTISNDQESSTTLHGSDDVVTTSSDLSSSEDQSSTNGDDTNGVSTSPLREHGAKTEAVTDADVLKTGGEQDKANQPPGESVHAGQKRVKKEPYPIDFFFD